MTRYLGKTGLSLSVDWTRDVQTQEFRVINKEISYKKAWDGWDETVWNPKTEADDTIHMRGPLEREWSALVDTVGLHA